MPAGFSVVKAAQPLSRALTQPLTAALVKDALLGGARQPTYYVNASTGSDLNDGRTLATAWQTLAKVSAAALVVGNIVAFCGGQTFTGTLTVPASGSAVAPIIFTSYGLGRATISPPDANTDAFDCLNKSYVTVDGIDFAGLGTAGTGSGLYFSASTANQAGIIVQNTNISNFGGGGIYIGGDAGTFGFTGVLVQNFAISGNKADGFASYGSTGNARVHNNITLKNGSLTNNGLSGAYIGNTLNSHSVDANGNITYNVDAYINVTASGNGALSTAGPIGLWSYESSGIRTAFCTSSNNTSANTTDGDGFGHDEGDVNCTIEYCLSTGNKGAGFQFWNQTQNYVMDNNIVRFCIGINNVNTGTFYGELVIGYSGTVAPTNCKVYGNSFFNSRAGVSVLQIKNAGVTGRFANNNLCAYGATTNLATVVGNPASLFCTGNNWYALNTFSITWNSTTYTSYAAWQTATGQEKIGGVNVGYNVDPGFVNPGSTTASDYKLVTGAAMLTAGLDLQAQFSINPGTRDYFGAAVSSGSSFSVGAAGPLSSGTGYVFTNIEATRVAAAFTTPPTTARKTLIDNLVGSLKSAGIWAQLDTFYAMAAADSQAGKINWKSPGTFDLIAVNTLTFTADRGFTGDGSTSRLRTQYTPSTNGVNYTLNSASIWLWSLTSGQNTTQDIGMSGAQGAYISCRDTTDKFASRLNDGTPSAIANADGSGFFSFQRTDSASRKATRNGALLGTANTASTSIAASEMWICGRNGSGFSNRQQSIAAFGASLNGLEGTFYTAVLTYMQGIGAA